MTLSIPDRPIMSLRWLFLSPALLWLTSQVCFADPWVTINWPTNYLPVAEGAVQCQGNFSAGIERINVYVDAAYAGQAVLNPGDRVWSFDVDFIGTPRQVRVIGFDDQDTPAAAPPVDLIAQRRFGDAGNFPCDNAGAFLQHIGPVSGDPPADLPRWSLREEGGDIRLYQRAGIDNDTSADWITLPRCGLNPNFELRFSLKPESTPAADDRFHIVLGSNLRVTLAPTAADTQLADASGPGFPVLATATAPGLVDGWATVKVRRFGETIEVVRDDQVILTYTNPASAQAIGVLRLGNGVAAQTGVFLDEILLDTLSATGAAQPAPVVTWLYPEEPEPGRNALLPVDKAVDLRWNIAPNGIETVQVYAGSSQAGAATYDTQNQVWNLPWQTPFAGLQNLHLQLADTSGNIFCYPPVTVELVEAAAPRAQILSPNTRRIRLADLEDGLILQGEARSLIGAPITPRWTVAEAPAGGTAEIDDKDALETAIRFDTEGLYRIQFSATDSQGTGSAELEVLAGTAPPAAPSSGIIAYYPLNTGLANTAGPAPDAVAVGGAAIENSAGLGGAVLLDGAVDRVDIPADPSINDSFSQRAISVWFKPKPASLSGTRVIFEEGGTSRALVIYLQDGVLYAGGYNKNSAEFFPSSTNIFPDDWNHVVVTTNTLESRTYLNGSLLQAGPALNLSDHGDPNALGGVNNATRLHTGDLFGGGFFAGWIDEVRLYDRHLSSAEVTDLYDSFSPTAPAVDVGDDLSALCTTTVDLAANAIAEPGGTTSWTFLSGPETVLLPSNSFVPAVPGVYQFRVSVEIPLATTFEELAVTASPISYDDFISYHHPEMTGNDALPNADWEDDGLANDLEFRMGTALTQATYQPVKLAGAAPGWQFRYPVNPGADAPPRPMLSGNLAGWVEAVHGQNGISVIRQGATMHLQVPAILYPTTVFLRLESL